MEKIEIRSLTTLEELKHMQEVEAEVWQMTPTPLHQTFTALNNGGILLGAFRDEKMIGFLYSFAGFDGKVPYVCSHMLGILPAYQTSGIGVKMKQKQAKIAREKGYPMLTWTFDPLESRNAYLNLHKLGARGVIYKPNYYGSMHDDLNQGLPTDRIHIRWDLHQTKEDLSFTFDPEQLLLGQDEAGSPAITEAFHTSDFRKSDVFFMAIPATFQAIKQTDFQLAKKWRMETRKVFLTLFEHGFQAKDLIRGERSVHYYVFAK
ncbi:MAG TPA: GNAT family N-acetyltransferase [Virgibacillus sp.]|nr:GNAT family N-acetyltransferase [Virgibacillus sp.]HLR69192.1 GNAT family N-acetyltransferase [Virgibacillus sp.]